MISSSIYIFEAGSTKTDVLIYKDNLKTQLTLSGFNPNREDTNFKQELQSLNIPKNAEIHFYGSGVNGDRNKQKVLDLFQSNNITANADSLGAARALFNHTKGIACILGTGGNVMYYDGTCVIDNHGGYGYLIDDYGGGLELSKIVVSKWLNGGFNAQTNSVIEDYFSATKINFISRFYQDKNLHHLSGLCRLLVKLAVHDESLNSTIQNYFHEFVDRHIYPLCEKYNSFEVNIVGSIGFHYEKWIIIATMARGVQLGKMIPKPIDELLKYHLSKK